MNRKLSKEETIELITKMCNGEGNDDEIEKWLKILKENVNYPNVSDLIFWNDEGLSPDEIADKAINYKPNKAIEY